MKVDCPIGRRDHSHVSIVLDLSVGAPGNDFVKEVVFKLGRCRGGVS